MVSTLLAEKNVVCVQADLAAHLARNEVIVAGKHFHGDAVVLAR